MLKYGMPKWNYFSVLAVETDITQPAPWPGARVDAGGARRARAGGLGAVTGGHSAETFCHFSGFLDVCGS